MQGGEYGCPILPPSVFRCPKFQICRPWTSCRTCWQFRSVYARRYTDLLIGIGQPTYRNDCVVLNDSFVSYWKLRQLLTFSLSGLNIAPACVESFLVSKLRKPSQWFCVLKKLICSCLVRHVWRFQKIHISCYCTSINCKYFVADDGCVRIEQLRYLKRQTDKVM